MKIPVVQLAWAAIFLKMHLFGIHTFGINDVSQVFYCSKKEQTLETQKGTPLIATTFFETGTAPSRRKGGGAGGC